MIKQKRELHYKILLNILRQCCQKVIRTCPHFQLLLIFMIVLSLLFRFSEFWSIFTIFFLKIVVKQPAKYRVASLATLTPSAGRDLVCCSKKVQYPFREESNSSIFTLKSMMIKSC